MTFRRKGKKFHRLFTIGFGQAKRQPVLSKQYQLKSNSAYHPNASKLSMSLLLGFVLIPEGNFAVSH